MKLMMRRSRPRCGTTASGSGSAPGAVEHPEDDDHQWQGRTERFGVETAFRYDDEGLLWLRTAGNMDDVDLFHTGGRAEEIQLFGEWIPFLRQSCVIKAQDFARLLAHFTIGVRGVFKQRRIGRGRARQPSAVRSASLFFEGRSLDDDVTEWNGAAVPPRDRSWGMDRMVVRDFSRRFNFYLRAVRSGARCGLRRSADAAAAGGARLFPEATRRAVHLLCEINQRGSGATSRRWREAPEI